MKKISIGLSVNVPTVIFNDGTRAFSPSGANSRPDDCDVKVFASCSADIPKEREREVAAFLFGVNQQDVIYEGAGTGITPNTCAGPDPYHAIYDDVINSKAFQSTAYMEEVNDVLLHHDAPSSFAESNFFRRLAILFNNGKGYIPTDVPVTELNLLERVVITTSGVGIIGDASGFSLAKLGAEIFIMYSDETTPTIKAIYGLNFNDGDEIIAAHYITPDGSEDTGVFVRVAMVGAVDDINVWGLKHVLTTGHTPDRITWLHPAGDNLVFKLNPKPILKLLDGVRDNLNSLHGMFHSTRGIYSGIRIVEV